MTKKGIKYLGDKNGIPQFEEYNVEEVAEVQAYNYDQLVVDYIREKYSQDDEFALNSKSMQLYLNSCTEEQKVKWTAEIREFTNYRMQCIKKAKEICSVKQ